LDPDTSIGRGDQAKEHDGQPTKYAERNRLDQSAELGAEAQENSDNRSNDEDQGE
jgi:hypothetical protein